MGGNFLVKGSFSPIEAPTCFKTLESDSNGHSSAEDEVYNEIEDQENICDDRTNSIRGTTWPGLILREILTWCHFV